MPATLLIEPVWNRNGPATSLSLQTMATALLLIEPVWNRNVFGAVPDRYPHLTFNRTSMESKPT